MGVDIRQEVGKFWICISCWRVSKIKKSFIIV